MSRSDKVYYHQRRAEQEVMAAAEATDRSIVLAHYQLSCLHLDAMAMLGQDSEDQTPAPPFMLSAKSG